ncbi:MAG TPA: replicative DNA helicase [Acidimicrobiales bacterium]|nr:replicative DNA helicase [Acidimicrobiales bacterium]
MAVTDDPRRPMRGDGRVPPYNLEAEESLLGAMLLSKDAIVAASELGVTADDFYKPVHAHIYDAITSLYSAGEPADPVTVAEELRRAGLLGDMAGPGPLVSLQVRTPATSSAARYARIVSEHAVLRRLIAVAGEIAEMGYRVPDDVAEAVDRAEAMVFDVAQHRVSDTLAPIRDLLDHSLTRLEMLYEKGDAITGIPTGYDGLDELLSGLQPSSLVIVGARPATGKCLTGDTLLTDPRTGARSTLSELYRLGSRGSPVEVLSLGGDRKLHVRRPSAFVDDGVRPVFEVRTRSGRVVRTTASHPFLTSSGWRPLAEISVGTAIAVPRALPVFGHDDLPEVEVVLLAYLLSDGAHTGASVRFASASSVVIDDLQRHARSFGVEPVAERGSGPVMAVRLRPARGHADPLASLLASHGLATTSAYCRSVPEAVFRLPRAQLALFLNRLLGADGSAWWSMRDGGSACLSYCSVSQHMASDIAHLLLRFGINARLRRRVVHRQGWRGPAHEVEVAWAPDIRRLAAEIGMFSKDSALANLLGRIEHQARAVTSYPGSPLASGSWEPPVERRARSLAAIGQPRPGAPSGAFGGHPRPAPAPAPAGVYDALGNGAGHEGAAVAWDPVVAIDAVGTAQVYDLTVPGDHNFVAADVFVHNTAFALGMAAHAALEANRPVLFFSLEMSHLEITQRLLASEARVDSTRMRNGRLAEADWSKISHAIGRLAEAPIYIDDNPRATVLEIRAKSRRLKSRLGDLGMVVVDYLQLMTGRDRSENRQVEVSEISRGLKVLARELQTPVVALSQLSRGLELRADKRPMLADLRESGCLSADARVLRSDTGTEVTMGELWASGERDIPVWTVDHDLDLVPGTMTNVWMSGHKRVHALRVASGRHIKASANHPFLTVDGWRRLDELRPGTEVAIPRRLPIPWRSADDGSSTTMAGSLATTAAGGTKRRGRSGPRATTMPYASDLSWDPVVSIEPLGVEAVFDATVANTHNFIANGIVVENSLEQDADVVIFLYRDELYHVESPDRGTAEVLVAKHRSGPTGMERLAFLDHYTRFANMAKGFDS